MTDPDVDAYLERSERWPAEMAELRSVLLERGLSEAIKWNKPCYSHDGTNIAVMQEMKGFLSLLFFKGVLLDDPDGVLESQGPNTRSARRVCFRSVDDVAELADTVRALVDSAVEVEEAGLEVEPPNEVVFGDELQARLDGDTAFRNAFEALTPGRQREYDLHISSAKQAKTREARIEKFAPKILAGKGFRDR